LHAAIAKRPNISHAVGVVSKFNSQPTQAHQTAVKRILCYLKGSIDVSLEYHRRDSCELIDYSDADWANDLDTRHSTTENVFIMSGGAISWLSQKQATVALSTAEVKYVALSSAMQEAIWLRRLLSDLDMNMPESIVIQEDNQGAIAMSKNPVGHKRTKHIDIRFHFVREAVQIGLIELQYCSTENMIADILTKPLPAERFVKLRYAIGMSMFADKQ